MNKENKTDFKKTENLEDKQQTNIDTKETKWYIVNSKNGQEETIKNQIVSRIHLFNLDRYFFDIKIITENHLKKNTKKIIKKNIYPGYIFINVIMNNKVWYVIRNTQGVIGFIGSFGKGIKPFPLSSDEVDKLLNNNSDEMNQYLKSPFKINDKVKIISGLFENEQGKILNINLNKAIAIVELNIFNRLTPTEFSFKLLQKIN